jgi:hypothetical protein
MRGGSEKDSILRDAATRRSTAASIGALTIWEAGMARNGYDYLKHQKEQAKKKKKAEKRQRKIDRKKTSDDDQTDKSDQSPEWTVQYWPTTAARSVESVSQAVNRQERTLMNRAKEKSIFEKFLTAVQKLGTTPKSEIERRIDNARRERRAKMKG